MNIHEIDTREYRFRTTIRVSHKDNIPCGVIPTTLSAVENGEANAFNSDDICAVNLFIVIQRKANLL